MYKYVYLVATLKNNRYQHSGIAKLDVRMVAREPKSLGQNEFAYRIKIEVDETKWKKRIVEATLPMVEPPELPAINLTETRVAKSTEMQVYDKLKGK